MKRVLLMLLATVPVSALFGSPVAISDEAVNVLLIVSEDNGAELGCYGDPYVKTPNLDRLSAEGVRFANAYVTHAVCSASRASFLTGLYPSQNGQIGLATHRYAMFRPWDNIPSILKGRGYRTGLIGKLHVNPESAFPFDFRWADPSAVSFGRRDVKKVAEAAGKFFADCGKQPFFLSVNFSDAHFPLLRQQNGLPETPLSAAQVKPLPFIGADSPRLRQGTADYYNCLMRLDMGVGMLLEQLKQAGKADNTLVIYIGDHGAQFSRGKATCYEGGLRIPMILRQPGHVEAGLVRDQLVSTVDILPTVLEAVGLPPRADRPGRSLLALTRNENAPWREYLFAERTAFHAGSFLPQRTLRDGRYKVIVNLTPERTNPVAERYLTHDGSFFIYGTEQEEIDVARPQVQQAYRTWHNPPEVELYDLKNDPWEFKDLADDPKLAGEKKRLLDALEAFRRKHGDPLLDPVKLAKLADEHDFVAEHVGGGRYGSGQSWKYLKYLTDSEANNAIPPVQWPEEPAISTVFQRDTDGYPHIRIPAVIVTAKGTVLALAEGRQGGDHSQNDIILKRSTDGGRTWGPLQVVHEDGTNVLVNPTAVVLGSGRVLLMFQRFPAGYHARAMGTHVKLLAPGHQGDTISTTLVMHSDDDGKTWSAPRDVTAGTKRPEKINSTATGPGIGIVLRRGPHKGRIIMPTNEGWWEGDRRLFNVYACYSDDGGDTWRSGEPAPNGDAGFGNEVQMVELADGAVMLNSRSNAGNGCRKIAVSRDGGHTWSPLKDDPRLPEPECQGTILRYDRAGDGRERLLFANPASQKGRSSGTIRVSSDDGKTWPVARTVYPGGYAYSCLTALPDGTIGLLFEADGYKRIGFARISLDWLEYDTEADNRASAKAIDPMAPAPRPRRSAKRDTPLNVLFVAIDDLRPELGCYGVEHVKSPNIDRLAGEGVLFRRAYCQQALCNPSRTSLLTGMRPDSVGVVGNHVHFRTAHPAVATLPQHFKTHGYHAAAIGKIYHGPFPEGASRTVWDTMGDPPSWSEPATRFGPRYYFTPDAMAAVKDVYRRMYGVANPEPDDWTKKLVFGPMTEAPDVPDDALYDGKVARAAVEKLGHFKAAEKPFFLAVGFIKPHTPFVAPKRYWDLYDPAELPLAANPAFPENAPPLAGHDSSEVRRYTDQPKEGPFEESNQRRLRHGYFACVSFIDAQVGRVLAELDRLGLAENTVVMLWGDHGWHLGEQGLWGKVTCFENAARAPLMVRMPGAAGNGRATDSLVEFVDMYPTLCDLAGLPLPAHVEGTSFGPLLDDPQQAWKQGALTQHPRGGNVMGYSLRTDRYRYTAWVDLGKKEIVARELYDHENDSLETVNVVAKPLHAKQVEQLHEQLSAAMPGVLEPAAAATRADSGVDFEEFTAGPLTKAADKWGSWEAEPGHATIHNQHARAGRQSLRLLGGDARQVTWTPTVTEPVNQLDLWFERWTRRTPFEFRAEVRIDGQWQTIHHDMGKAVIGSFKNHLALPLPGERPEAFRFSCTTPPGSGLMIDDLRLVRATPMRVESVTSEQSMAPVLVRNEVNPVLDVQIATDGGAKPLAVTELRVSLAGTTDPDGIESVDVFYEGAESPTFLRNPGALATGGVRFGTAMKPAADLVFTGKQRLTPGMNHFWVSVKLKHSVDPVHHIMVECDGVVVDGEGDASRSLKPTTSSGHKPLRIGYAVRKAGDDGSAAYRIPGLVTTNKGTLIGVYDVRYRGWGDLPGDIDIGMSRSTDGGRSWEPMQVILDMGDDPDWEYDGIGDPAVLVDRQTNTIWVAATWSHGNRSWFGSGPGLASEETGQFMLVRSDDDGLTWSEPINITEQVKDPRWCFILQGPGRGITMQDGTLVFAAQYQDPPENGRLPHSTIIYSRDRGRTWQVGTGAFDDTTEAQVVELEPGVLMLNCRYDRQNRRVVMVTRDMGRTWTEHPTSRTALPEPGACMASLLRVDRGEDMKPLFAFSNPAVEDRPRRNTTIKLSADGCASWPESMQLLLDAGSNAGYSCLTQIDEHTLGILYESSRAHMAFQRIELKELADAMD